MSNRTLYRFELSWHYARNPRVGERITLAVTEDGPILSCTIDDKFYDLPLNGKVDHFSELLEHSILRYLDGKTYKNHCVLDGANWRLNIQTGDVHIVSSGLNYYPWEFRESMNLFHDYFKLPWSRIHKEFRTMAHYETKDRDCIRVEMDGEEYTLDHFLAPEEGPDGIDRWTSNGMQKHKMTPAPGAKKPPEKEQPTRLTFEEAKAIAVDRKPNVDTYTECENGYIFGSTEDAGLIGPSPIIVMKDTGEVFGMIDAPRDLGERIGPARLFTGELLAPEEEY